MENSRTEKETIFLLTTLENSKMERYSIPLLRKKPSKQAYMTKKVIDLCFPGGCTPGNKRYRSGCTWNERGGRKTLIIPPEDAYGEYKDYLVQTIPLVRLELRPLLSRERKSQHLAAEKSSAQLHGNCCHLV